MTESGGDPDMQGPLRVDSSYRLVLEGLSFVVFFVLLACLCVS